MSSTMSFDCNTTLLNLNKKATKYTSLSYHDSSRDLYSIQTPKGDIQRVEIAFIQPNKKLVTLLFTAKKDMRAKYFGNGLPGGYLKEGETILECLQRKFKEQTGNRLPTQFTIINEQVYTYKNARVPKKCLVITARLKSTHPFVFKRTHKCSKMLSSTLSENKKEIKIHPNFYRRDETIQRISLLRF
jgi:hypothetical protein